jgi:glycosyltransferase involved in cell wall biosynthesis
MRIGFTSSGLDHGRSGIGIYISSLLNALQKVDHRNHYDLFMEAADTKLIPLINLNFQQKTFSAFNAKPIPSILWHNSFLPLQARSRGYDLVHIPTLRRIPLIKGSPVVATVHDLAPFAFPEKYDRLRLFYHHQILSRLIRRCDQIIAVSHHTKQDIIRYTGYPAERITVIYSGIDHALFQPRPLLQAQSYLEQHYRIRDPFLVYVARIEHPGKNHLNLIKAFEIYKNQTGSPHQLVLAGADWSGAATVKRYAAESRWRDSIHFLGFVPQEAIINLYSACELMVFPSFYEGFGFPMIEAMACGSPVIAANSSSLAEIGQGYAELFDPYDPAQIARCIADHLKKGRVATENQRRYAQQFNWEKAAQQVLGVYEKAAGSTG